MKNKTISNVAKGVQRSARKSSPMILIGLGIGGFVATAILTGKASIKAEEVLKEKKESISKKEGCDVEEVKLSVEDTVKATYKYFIPPVIAGIASTVCILGSNSIHLKRTAALASAYEIAQVGIREYKDSVVEIVGKEKEKEIREKTAEKKIVKSAPASQTVILGEGDYWCLDDLTGKKFRTNKNKIDAAFNTINARIYHDNYASLNELYEELGAPRCDLGDLLGWNNDIREVKYYVYGAVTEDGEPCLALAIESDTLPQYDFNAFM